MRKLFTKGLSNLMIFVLVGCTTDQASLLSKQQKAVNNSIAYIKNSSFNSKERINTKVISISLATESTWKSTWDMDFIVDKRPSILQIGSLQSEKVLVMTLRSSCVTVKAAK